MAWSHVHVVALPAVVFEQLPKAAEDEGDVTFVVGHPITSSARTPLIAVLDADAATELRLGPPRCFALAAEKVETKPEREKKPSGRSTLTYQRQMISG